MILKYSTNNFKSVCIYLIVIQVFFLMMLVGCENVQKSGTKVNLPNRGSVGIICKYKSRVMTPEGQERSLILELTGEKPVFFRYPETFAGDKTIIDVYLYPKAHILQLKDTMAKNLTVNAEHECILNIETLNLKYIIRDPNGTVYAANISQAYKSNPLDLSLGKSEIIFPDVDISVSSPYNPIIEGQSAQVSEELWTSTKGTFIGTLTCN